MQKVLQKSLCRLQALLLLVVMFIGGGSAVWAEDLTATFDLAVSNGQEGWSNNSVTTNEITCERSGSYASTGINLWQATHYIKVSVPSEVKITKIVLRGLQGYFNGSSYGSINITKTNGSFEGGATSWTSSSDATWENTDETFEVQFSTTYGNDFYVRYVDVYTGTTVDDGSVKSTFNFNQASVPFVNAAGVAGNLQSGNRPSIGDVFTAPSGGATLTFNYVGESWSNSAQRLRLDEGADFTIAAPEGFEMTNIVFATDQNTMTFSSKTGLTGNGSTKATWEGKSESETFTISALSFIQNIKVTMVPVAEEGEITYTIDLVDAPTGAYVTLDGQRFEDDGTYPVEKSLGKNDLEAFEPEGYYAEVEYTRDNHTYTVTYKAYNYYDVTVTGTTDPAAGVVYNEQTYGNGSRIETKAVLTESSVTAAEVSGMKGTVSMSGNTFNVDYQEKLDFVIMTNTNQTSYYNSEYDVTITCLATWSSCLNFWRSADLTVESSTFLISRVEFEELYGATISGTSSYGNISNNVWEGTPSNNITFSTTSGDYRVKKLHIYLARPQVSTYTINLVDAPAGASVLVNNEKTVTTASDTYSTIAVLNENNVVVTCPETHYYEKAYDEGTHTFTVTFNEYYHYAVSVTGCTEATAGVRYDNRTYRNEETIQVKEPLADSDVEAVVVNGYEAAAPVVGTLDGHNATISVAYTEASEIEYTVTITGMPDGASVMIEDEEFFASGTHKSRKTLDSDDASVKNCPETHYPNEQYEWYDEDSRTFNITFSEYLAYTIAVDEASAYNGAEVGVKVHNNNTYLLGQTIYNKTALTESDVKAADVDGFTGTVTLADNVFTVSYVKDAFIKFDASKFTQDGGYGNLDETIEGVRLQCWDSGDYFGVNNRSNSHIVLSSSEAPIVKVEAEYISWGKPSYGYATIDGKNTGELNTEDDFTTWTGSTNDLELWDSTNNTAYVSSIKVYLAQATTYHVNIAGMPAEGASVVVNNNTYNADGNYDFVSYEELNENNVTVNVPQSHKYEKTYTEGTHTFDVTYTALDRYTVVADADNAYTGDGAGIKATIDLGPRNYTFGETFYNDGALEASAIEVNEVDGYTGTFVLDNDADPKTITVKYVENASETYTVEFAGNVPAGASVTITDASGDHVISAADDDQTYSTRYTVTEASAKAKQFEYYDATVTLDGTTFTVTYDNVDYILVDLSNASGYDLTRKSAEETVAVDFVVYNKCANLFGGTPITVTSNTYNIKKIEYVLAENYSDEKKAGTQFNWGAWTTEYEVWETNGNKTKSVVLSVPNGESTDICYTAVKVYLDTDPVGQFAMSAAGWATLCVNDDFILPEEYTAYTVGKLEGSTPVLEEDGQIVFTEIERVPAGTPVIICGPENANVSLLPTYGAVAPEVNYLYGNNTDVASTYYAATIADQGLGELDLNTMEYTHGSFGPCQLYQLAKENDLVGFYRQVADGVYLKCGAHKAFLVVPSTVASSNSRFVFPGQEGTLTGINAVAADDAEAIYNLQGQRVTATKAGVYVKNGRKFIVK